MELVDPLTLESEPVDNCVCNISPGRSGHPSEGQIDPNLHWPSEIEPTLGALSGVGQNETVEPGDPEIRQLTRIEADIPIPPPVTDTYTEEPYVVLDSNPTSESPEVEDIPTNITEHLKRIFPDIRTHYVVPEAPPGGAQTFVNRIAARVHVLCDKLTNELYVNMTEKAFDRVVTEFNVGLVALLQPQRRTAPQSSPESLPRRKWSGRKGFKDSRVTNDLIKIGAWRRLLDRTRPHQGNPRWTEADYAEKLLPSDPSYEVPSELCERQVLPHLGDLDVSFSEEDITRAIRKLRKASSPGPCGLSPSVVCACAKLPCFRRALTKLFNTSLASGYEPTPLRASRAVGVMKSDGGLRPIVIQSTLGRLLSQMVSTVLQPLVRPHLEGYQLCLSKCGINSWRFRLWYR